ncbi:hypothetical protein F2Q69_00007694 [Brassica cretica]|uniref:Uncharacterized protein n=1 Tax=Brassica cretica TaxID=69181 RepID=A0A8S9P8K6_BRACR|nr:hypothetical protein F2Q69_00007694 [Brassica cretica]
MVSMSSVVHMPDMTGSTTLVISCLVVMEPSQVLMTRRPELSRGTPDSNSREHTQEGKPGVAAQVLDLKTLLLLPTFVGTMPF